jgi:hypothetical protein
LTSFVFAADVVNERDEFTERQWLPFVIGLHGMILNYRLFVRVLAEHAVHRADDAAQCATKA